MPWREALFIFLFLTSAPAQALKLYFEVDPPLSELSKGQPKGLVVDIVQEAQMRLGDKSPLEFIPYDTLYKESQEQPDVVIASRTRAADQEKLFKWVGPLEYTYWVMVQRKTNAKTYQSWSDLKSAKGIGTSRNDMFEIQAMNQELKTNGFRNLKNAKSNDANLDLLMNGKIELWLTDTNNLMDFVQDHHIDRSVIQIAYFLRRHREISMAFSKKTSDAVVDRWQKALKELKDDGSLDRIHLRNESPPVDFLPPAYRSKPEYEEPTACDCK